MNPNSNSDSNGSLLAFITTKRQQGQKDDLILEELVAAGWDRIAVLQALGGKDVPAPAAPAAPAAGQPAVTSQTGNPGQPLQLETVHYNISVGKVRSRIGVSARVASLMLWLSAGTIAIILLALRASILPDPNEDLSGLSQALVFGIAVLIPIVPLLWFALRRMNRMLAENPANSDDLYFKKTIRFNLWVWMIFSLFWAIAAVYNIMAKAFLHNPVSRSAIIDAFIFALTAIATLYVFWRYYRISRR